MALVDQPDPALRWVPQVRLLPLFLPRPYYYYGPGYYPYPYAGLPAVAFGGYYGHPYPIYRGYRGYAGGWHGRR